MFAPYTNPEKQYQLGLIVLINNIKSAPHLFLREEAAFGFLGEYHQRFKSVREFLEGVIVSLYHHNLQEFIDHLTERERKSFVRTISSIKRELDLREMQP